MQETIGVGTMPSRQIISGQSLGVLLINIPTKAAIAPRIAALGSQSKTPKATRSVTFELHPDSIAEIDAIAKSKGISRGAEIRQLL
jgi:hypothetical protein